MCRPLARAVLGPVSLRRPSRHLNTACSRAHRFTAAATSSDGQDGVCFDLDVVGRCSASVGLYPSLLSPMIGWPVDAQLHDQPRDIGVILAEFSSVVAEQRSVEDILSRMSNYVTELLPVHGVGVLSRDADGELLTFATANTDIGQVVEELEVECGEGPCSDALHTGAQVLAPDLALLEDRYPRFVPRALEAGVRSIHALPMIARMEPLGALDVIALEPRHLTASQLLQAQLLADVAVAYLMGSAALVQSTRLAEQLQSALDSRVVIEQAKGMLAARHGVTVTDAFELLRMHARRTSRKTQDVAADVTSDELEL
jgi:hypothetical protein